MKQQKIQNKSPKFSKKFREVNLEPWGEPWGKVSFQVTNMLKLQALRSLKNQHSQHQQPGERSVRKRAKKYNKRRKTVAFNFDEAIERSAGKTKDSAGSRHLGGILKQSKISRWDGISVKSGNPWRCHQIYLHAASLGSKIPRLNSFKEKLN